MTDSPGFVLALCLLTLGLWAGAAQAQALDQRLTNATTGTGNHGATFRQFHGAS